MKWPLLDRDTKVSEVDSAIDTLFPCLSGWIEIRLIDPCGEERATCLWFENTKGVAARIVEAVEPFEGKKNAYIGRALRDRSGEGSEDSVSAVACVSIDIDPVRPKGSPSSDNELGYAEEVGDDVIDYLGGRGRLVRSGNGVQVWVPISVVDIRGRRDWWKAAHKAWEAWVHGNFNTDTHLQFDPQFDIPRVVCLPGFLKVKGEENDAEERWYRPALMLEAPDTRDYFSVYDAERILAFAPKAGERRDVAFKAPSIPVPARFWRLLNEDVMLYESYNGERRDLADPSNSTQNMALVNRLRYHGFRREEAAAILLAAPSLKQRANEYYLGLTLKKVYGE